MERREALITGVVLAVASALITILAVTASGPGPGVALVDDASGSDGPIDSSGDHDDADAGVELEAFVDEAIAFVEATRGRRFLTEPEVVVLDDVEFVERLDADLEEDFAVDPDGVAMYNAFYRSLGLIAADDSIDEIYRDFSAAGILGLYNPTTDELVVRQVDELSLLTKSTIIHELAHAFDDQHFDLDRPEYDDRTDEIPWTFRAVVEGSASWVEAEWETELSSAEQSSLLNEELGFGDPSIFDRFELSFLLYEFSPYDYGEPFVGHIVGRGGTTALDDALIEPPVTSEQVMLPRRFDQGELALPLDPPAFDGEVVFQGVGGNALIEALFQGNGVFRNVEWGGDQVSVWVDDGLSCVRWDIRSDDAAGLADMRAGFEEWGDRVGDTTVSVVDDVTIRVDRCA